VTLKEKALRMRNAINDIELALSGADDLIAWPERWKGGARLSEITAMPKIKGDVVCQIVEAYRELNNIANDEDFSFSHFNRS
jgi:hypothetical protein